MAHSDRLVRLVCQLRQDGLSYGQIGYQAGITKNRAQNIVYRFLYGINRHQRYKKRHGLHPIMDRGRRPTVPFITGLNDGLWYVLDRREED